MSHLITTEEKTYSRPVNGRHVFLNGEIHDWYRIVLGYSDKLVSEILEEFHLQHSDKVLDPFCGTGTTQVECMKRGIPSTGIDANPASYFSARVKTNWTLNPTKLARALDLLSDKYKEVRRERRRFNSDPTFIYLERSGMIDRGWISTRPLQKALAIKHCIWSLGVPKQYKDILMLALVAEVVHGSSNIRFGPELYCTIPKPDSDVFGGLSLRVKTMVSDLSKVRAVRGEGAKVILGDSRDCQLLIDSAEGPYDAIISSPPYPAEHDYTRNSRLELAFLEDVFDRESLRKIKKNMIRSHTKGIYKEDGDTQLVKGNQKVQALVRIIEKKVKSKKHGFARLYPKVLQEYFGGMKRHFISVRPLLREGAKCAYVVGDQSSYLQVHIPTAEILSSIAEEAGFRTLEIKRWRTRWSTTTSKELDENVLVIQKITA